MKDHLAVASKTPYLKPRMQAMGDIKEITLGGKRGHADFVLGIDDEGDPGHGPGAPGS
ncbi:MAG: hypothetical protein NTW86_25475 [Candidatus Sumerlaeota bacterium]|nr:hypothetical protein [Candidatus Sumerlaeota bacterium]